MANDQTTIAERLFNGSFAESELHEMLSDVKYDELIWDYYDYSLEIRGSPDTYRLPSELQSALFNAGFRKVYINHTDKWETHYSFEQEFSPVDGWRVSYPHKRGDGERSIWVEKHVEGWPKEWFDTGYVIVKDIKP